VANCQLGAEIRYSFHTNCELSFGVDSLILLFQINRVRSLTVSTCFRPPRRDSAISNTRSRRKRCHITLGLHIHEIGMSQPEFAIDAIHL